jgi:hypothetical protein
VFGWSGDSILKNTRKHRDSAKIQAEEPIPRAAKYESANFPADLLTRHVREADADSLRSSKEYRRNCHPDGPKSIVGYVKRTLPQTAWNPIFSIANHFPISAQNSDMNAETRIVRLIAKGKTVKNVTVAIPDDCYRRARVWAAQNDTSISAIVQDMLNNLPRLARAYSAMFVRPAAPQNAGKANANRESDTVNPTITNTDSSTSNDANHEKALPQKL